MVQKISAVINTLNEEKNIEQAIKSLSFVDEIIVCDMHSDDKTVEIAKKLGAKIIYHKRTGYVEPARNFAISKVTGDWVLILDADEEIPEKLAKELKEMVNKPLVSDYVRIPRKNIIFGRWMRASMWWPDYNIRFFRKGTVKWLDKIHRPPEVSGQGLDLPEKEEMAMIHYHYDSIGQFIERLNRYTTVQAKELVKDGYKFFWQDLITKPTGEFSGRFFANRGFEDGLHGLALSLLQASSFLVMYLKVWEIEKFTEREINLKELKETKKKMGFEIDYWFKYGTMSKNPFKRFFQRAKNKIF